MGTLTETDRLIIRAAANILCQQADDLSTWGGDTARYAASSATFASGQIEYALRQIDHATAKLADEIAAQQSLRVRPQDAA